MPRPRRPVTFDLREWMNICDFPAILMMSWWFSALDGVPSQFDDFNIESPIGFVAALLTMGFVVFLLPIWKWTKQEMAMKYSCAFLILFFSSKGLVEKLNSKWKIPQGLCEDTSTAKLTLLAAFRMWNAEFHFDTIVTSIFCVMFLMHAILVYNRMRSQQYTWEDLRKLGMAACWGLFVATACAPLVQQGFLLNKGALSPYTSCKSHPMWNFLGVKPAGISNRTHTEPRSCGFILCNKTDIPNDPEGRRKYDSILPVTVPYHGISRDRNLKHILQFVGVKPDEVFGSFTHGSKDGKAISSLLFMKIAYVKAVLVQSPIISTIESVRNFDVAMFARTLVLYGAQWFIPNFLPDNNTRKGVFVVLTLASVAMAYFMPNLVFDSVSSTIGKAGSFASVAEYTLESVAMACFAPISLLNFVSSTIGKAGSLPIDKTGSWASTAGYGVKNASTCLYQLVLNAYRNETVKKFCDFVVMIFIWIFMYYVATFVLLKWYIDNDLLFRYRLLLGTGRLLVFNIPALWIGLGKNGQFDERPCVLLTITHEVVTGWYVGPAFAEPLLALLFCSFVMLCADLYETQKGKRDGYNLRPL